MRILPGLVAATIVFAHAAQAENHASPDMVVATVNGTDITLGHMIVLKAQLPEQYRSLPPEILYEGVLDQLIQQTLLGDTVTELSAGSRASLDNEGRALRASEAMIEIGEAAVTDEAVQEAYDKMVEAQSGEKEWNVSHILFEQEDGMEPGTAEQEAKDAIAAIEGGADFAEIAREQSDGPSGPGGGVLGWYGTGVFVPEFDQAMSEMGAGDMTPEPVQTRFGWHVIKVEDVRAKEAPPLDQVRPQIENELSRSAIEARAEELLGSAEITRMTVEEIDPALLNAVELLEN